MDLMIKLTIGLLVFMMANVILGSVNSMFDGTFNKKKFLSGIGKALVILMVYVAVYFVSMLNPNIMTLNINEIEVNMTTAIYTVAIGGYVSYGKQLIEKLKILTTPKNK